MPIALTEYTQYHPTRLTRQSDNPVMSGTYTLEALTALYGGANESETLRFAAMQGQAFFKKADGFTAFNPIPGETSDLPLDVNPDAEAEAIGAEAEAIEPGLIPLVIPVNADEAEAEAEVNADEAEVNADEAEVNADEAEAEYDTDEDDTDDDEEGNDIF